MNCKKMMKMAMAFALSAELAVGSNMISVNSFKGNNKVMANALSASDFAYYNNFESGAGDWEGRGGATTAVSSENKFEGSKSLYVSGRSDTWQGCQLSVNSLCNAGSSYSFSVAVSPCGKKAVEMMLSLQYNIGDTTEYGHIASLKVNPGKWGVLSATEYQIPSGATDLSLYVETATGSNDFYIDEIAIGEPGKVGDSMKYGEKVGDIDGDENITALDFAILRNFLNNSALSAPSSADINSDGSVDIADAVMLEEYLFEKITGFPEPAVIVEPEDDFEYESNLQFKEAPGNYLNPCQQAGKVITESYNGINGGNTLKVYLPYGYDESQKYNIFYIMHGGGENENTIFGTDCELDNILDHMIMDGVLEPTIVVTPTFNKCEAGTFYNEFRQSVIPFVEGKYSTYANGDTSAESIRESRMHRAYGGFSMGAVSTWAVMQNCLDIVGYFMPLSGDHWQGNSAQEKANSIGSAIDKSGLSDREYFVFAATGSDDIAYPNENPQIEVMKTMKQFKYTSDFSQGNLYFLVAPGKTHWWGYVRHYVYDGLPYFFHEG